MCKPLLVIGALLVIAAPVLACLWDEDTLRDERSGMPGIAEVLAGRFEKHSEFFYKKRIESMTALIAADPKNLAAYDNLAVAHEKLGDQDAAIAVMLEKEKIAPGEYTTAANLGTFYLHKGDFENGIAHIERALVINPDAHFGREEYQLKLARFLRDAKANPKLLETQNFLGVDFERGDEGQFRRVNDTLSRGPGPLGKLGLKENVFDGIVGMLRFGTGKSAELHFVLGELLAYRGDKHLAYRAYQRAIDLNHPRSEEIGHYMAAVKDGVEHAHNFAPEVIAKERADAEAWVKAYQDYEDQLLRDGKDVTDERSYAAFYRRHGQARVAETLSAVPSLKPRHYTYAALAGAVLFVIALVVIEVRQRLKKGRAARAAVTR